MVWHIAIAVSILLIFLLKLGVMENTTYLCRNTTPLVALGMAGMRTRKNRRRSALSFRDALENMTQMCEQASSFVRISATSLAAAPSYRSTVTWVLLLEGTVSGSISD